ncbi:MAG: hypothetical protein FJ147_25620 [Deltaproteobacteria bacterium]|nr:hypothetical protein [Deltaproteobacteria bacterium]
MWSSSVSPANVAVGLRNTLNLANAPNAGMIKERTMQMAQLQMVQQPPSPVNEALGHHRILPTSPLTEVPFVCCPTC